jgi:large subunit ribosomal protein L15
MRLNEISDNSGARPPRKRVGRGIGSGTGKTAARGHKGQKSRSGVSLLGFEGGQMPLFRRLPKGGFTNIFRKNYRVVNIGRLQRAVDSGKLDIGKPVTEATLVDVGVIKSVRDGVRLLGKGDLSAKLIITVSGASRGAIVSVEKAGGTVTLTTSAKINSDKPKKNKAKKAEMVNDDGGDAQGLDKE